MIQCNKCGEIKAESEYHKKRKTCKSCVAKRKAVYRENNKEKIAAYARRYREKYRDQINLQSKIYYQQNRLKILEQKKQYRSANPEKIKEARKRYLEKLTDSYIIKLITKDTPLKRTDVEHLTDLIETYRQYIINKRLIQLYESDKEYKRLAARNA